MFCGNCGRELPMDNLFCNYCGKAVAMVSSESGLSSPTALAVKMIPQTVVVIQNQKSPGAAAVLSFVIAGAGQIYNGQIGKGFAFLVCIVISWLLTSLVIGIVPLLILTIWSVVDAYRTAERINATALQRGSVA